MNILGKIASRAALVGMMGAFASAGCGGSNPSDAERRGIGASCAHNDGCQTGLTCLSFKGGYCGLVGCTNDTGCPAGSACVKHTNNGNYCFLICADKTECNRNRTVENEANCSANVSFIDAHANMKACVPPSAN